MHFLGINALVAERDFVLLVVVDGRHAFDKPEEDWNCIFGEVGACISVNLRLAGLKIGVGCEGRNGMGWGRNAL